MKKEFIKLIEATGIKKVDTKKMYTEGGILYYDGKFIDSIRHIVAKYSKHKEVVKKEKK